MENQIGNFKSFRDDEIEGQTAQAWFSFGRMNPPTPGHGKLFDRLMSESSDHHYLFLSQDRFVGGAEFIDREKSAGEMLGRNKNPLNYEIKSALVSKLFPNVNLIGTVTWNGENKDLNSALDIAAWLVEEKSYRDIVLLVGDDRVEPFKYVEIELQKRYGDEVLFNIESAGKRIPGAEGVEGMSASLVKEYVASKNWDKFREVYTTPSTSNLAGTGVLQDTDLFQLWNDIEAGLGPKMKKVKNRWVEDIEECTRLNVLSL
jgi:hypothetical protein